MNRQICKVISIFTSVVLILTVVQARTIHSIENYGLSKKWEKREFWSSTQFGPMPIACGDVDGDNISEIIQGGDHYDYPTTNSFLSVWKFDGSNYLQVDKIRWNASTPSNSNNYVNKILINDLDFDGKNEIITCGESPNQTVPYAGNIQLRVWNITSGKLYLKSSIETGKNISMQDFKIGDINNDGIKEIIVVGIYRANLSYGEFLIWQYKNNNINLIYKANASMMINYQLDQININDIDNDNNLEMITVANRQSPFIKNVSIALWSFNNTLIKEKEKNITAEDMPLTIGPFPSNMIIVDINDDGKEEILIGGVYTNKSSGLTESKVQIWNITSNFNLINEICWNDPPDGSARVANIDVDNIYGQIKILTFSKLLTGRGQIKIWFWENNTLKEESNTEWPFIASGYYLSEAIGDTDSDSLNETITMYGVAPSPGYWEYQFIVWGYVKIPEFTTLLILPVLTFIAIFIVVKLRKKQNN